MNVPFEYTLENDLVAFSLSVSQNAWRLVDKRARLRWGNPPGSLWVWMGPDLFQKPLNLQAVRVEGDPANPAALHCRFVDAQEEKSLELTFRLNGDALQVFAIEDETGWSEVELFAQGLQASVSEGGEALLPIRMGMLIPASGEQPIELTLGTYEYEGLHMAMAALFKRGAALMATWQDPYIKLWFSREPGADAYLTMSFKLSRTARSLELHCLGKGDWHTVAAAYRQRAAELGFRLPWSEKLKDRPQAEKLFGAANFKLWTALARRIDEQLVEQSVEVHWTFEQAAQIAEHLKHDLQLDDILFHLGGWTRYGYDCRHPDIMPANPECGGDEKLAECARRVQACGYTFCLHDNYQDMYRDAPSWDEKYIQKTQDGSLYKGGVWLGGQAYYTCAREALRLAMRPQNLPLVKQVVNPDLYFIDTTYAVGPQECFDPRHPLTRQDDIRWKAALSDYAGSVFGMFGSECGREWAVPHADFFEGLASVSGRYYHMLQPDELDALVIPFFDMIFHDCIVIHGKYGYNPAEMAEQVIHHAAMGRTLYYHNVPSGLYWQVDTKEELPLPEDGVDPALYTRAHQGWAEGLCQWDRFIKNTQEILGPLNKLTSQAYIERYDFLDASRKVRKTTFSNGVMVWVNGSREPYVLGTRRWGEVVLSPFGLLVEAPAFAAFVGVHWNDRPYASPVLFTLTSLDGKPLHKSNRVRLYHGFGEPVINWRGQLVTVSREAILPAARPKRP